MVDLTDAELDRLVERWPGYSTQSVAELEVRLEIDPAHPYDGIAVRDATIEGLQGQIAELEADRA